ncbi:unnamed protein product [Closterium sp. Naga37s-1]|nr:unnamed protein product [Closterium sp. Naga37s-1]
MQPEFFNNPASSKVNVARAAIAEVPGLQECLVCCMRLLTECAEMRDPSLDDTDSVTDWDVAIHVIITFFNLTMDRFYSLFDAAQARADAELLDTMVEIWQVQKPVFDGSMQAEDGPGELSLEGRPRHDNDHIEISAISVAPTMDEVLCDAAPYLPHNHPSEPHRLPAGSVGRHVDIQFRLLRHDLVAPLWSKALFLFHRLTHESSRGASSSRSSNRAGIGGDREEAMGLLRADRDLTRGLTDAMKGVVGLSSDDMDVYLLRDVHVLSIQADRRSGVYFLIDFLEPPMPRSRQTRDRVEFWENTRRLQNGALVWIRDMQPSPTHLHTHTQRTHMQQLLLQQQQLRVPLQSPHARDTPAASDASSHRLIFATITARDTKKLAAAQPQIGVQPCGGNGFSADLLGLIAQGSSQATQVVMLEAHGSFFAYEPILKALQGISEASLPFAEYICGVPDGAPWRGPGRAPGACKLPAYIRGDIDRIGT